VSRPAGAHGALKVPRGVAQEQSGLTGMVAISITPAAYEALQEIMPGIGVGAWSSHDLIVVWVDRKVADELSRLKGPSDSYSDVILRLAKQRS
jgi:predicted CopG family antitoxin